MATAPKPLTPSQHPIAPGTSIGYVHLKVSDLNRAVEFYRHVLGFDVMQRYGGPRLGLLRVMNGRSRQSTHHADNFRKWIKAIELQHQGGHREEPNGSDRPAQTQAARSKDFCTSGK